MKKDQRDEIAAALLAAMLSIYGAQMRLLLVQSGKGDRELVVSDADVITALTAWSRDRADVIIRWYNKLLGDHIAALDASLTDEQVLAALQSFFTDVTTYNAKTLVPYITAWTQQRAVEDFFTKNGIEDQVMWQIVPGETDMTDICLDAISAGLMTSEEASEYFGVFPAHQNCPHFLVPVVVGSALTLPADYWSGEATAVSEAA